MKQLVPDAREGLDPLSIYDDLEFPDRVVDGSTERPFVALNMVTSIDGKITFNLNEPRVPIGSPIDRALMGRLRVHFDAVLRGASTVRANPFLPNVPEAGVARRQAQGRSPQPLVVVLSRSLDLPWRSAFFHERDRVVIVTSRAAGSDLIEQARGYAHVETVGDEEVDFREALMVLRQKYGVNRVLAEGGADLNYHLFREGLLDELFWTLAPKISGLAADKTMVAGQAQILPTPKLRLKSLYLYDNELYHRWTVVR